MRMNSSFKVSDIYSRSSYDLGVPAVQKIKDEYKFYIEPVLLGRCKDMGTGKIKEEVERLKVEPFSLTFSAERIQYDPQESSPQIIEPKIIDVLPSKTSLSSSSPISPGSSILQKSPLTNMTTTKRPDIKSQINLPSPNIVNGVAVKKSPLIQGSISPALLGTSPRILDPALPKRVLVRGPGRNNSTTPEKRLKVLHPTVPGSPAISLPPPPPLLPLTPSVVRPSLPSHGTKSAVIRSSSQNVSSKLSPTAPHVNNQATSLIQLSNGQLIRIPKSALANIRQATPKVVPPSNPINNTPAATISAPGTSVLLSSPPSKNGGKPGQIILVRNNSGLNPASIPPTGTRVIVQRPGGGSNLSGAINSVSGTPHGIRIISPSVATPRQQSPAVILPNSPVNLNNLRTVGVTSTPVIARQQPVSTSTPIPTGSPRIIPGQKFVRIRANQGPNAPGPVVNGKTWTSAVKLSQQLRFLNPEEENSSEAEVGEAGTKNERINLNGEEASRDESSSNTSSSSILVSTVAASARSRGCKIQPLINVKSELRVPSSSESNYNHSSNLIKGASLSEVLMGISKRGVFIDTSQVLKKNDGSTPSQILNIPEDLANIKDLMEAAKARKRKLMEIREAMMLKSKSTAISTKRSINAKQMALKRLRAGPTSVNNSPIKKNVVNYFNKKRIKKKSKNPNYFIDEGLPDGWYVEQKQDTDGSFDIYFYTPENYKLRTHAEIVAYASKGMVSRRSKLTADLRPPAALTSMPVKKAKLVLKDILKKYPKASNHPLVHQKKTFKQTNLLQHFQKIKK